MTKKPDNMSTWPISSIGHNEIFDGGQSMGMSLSRSDTFISLFTPTTENHRATNIHAMNESILPKFEKFDMQTSDSCHKRFVIFDHTMTKNTVVVHPSWLNNQLCESALEPKINQSVRSFPDESFNQQVKEVIPSFFCFSSDLEANISMLNNDDIVQTNTATGIDVVFTTNREKHEITSYSNAQTRDKGETIFSQGSRIPSEFHEDTEEIDALLSSDDELSSTGHSPSDALSNYYHDIGIEHKGDSSIIGIKRKLENTCREENDDADSNQTSFQTIKESHCEDTWKSSLRNQAYMEMETCSSWSENSSGTLGAPMMDPSKRIKIKANINQLRNVIPGGIGLDTVGLLTQTVQYVMSLEGKLRDLVNIEKISNITQGNGDHFGWLM